MGMFPVQNYGEDFTKSMIGMGNFINGMDQRRVENERQVKTDERADRALKLQEDSSRATVEHNTAQTEKIKREEADAKDLQKWIRLQGEIDPAQPTRPMSKDALDTTAKLGARIEYFPNDLREVPVFDRAITSLGGAFNQLKQAAPADKAFSVRRGDAPQINDIADAHDYLYGDVQKKSHVNTGVIKELPQGAEYSINRTEGFTFTSDAGTGAYTPWYSIVDGNGNPVMKADGTPALVPRTVGRSNSPDAKVEVIPLEAAEMKLALGKSVSDAISRLSPEEQKYVQKRIHAERLALGDKTAERDDKPITLPSGSKLVSSDGKSTLAENARETKTEVFPINEGNNIVSYQGDKSQPKSTWVAVGKSPIRVAGSGGMENGSSSGKVESAFVNNFWKSYTLPAEPEANRVTPIDKTNHARVEYLLNEGANRGVQMVQVYDPVASKYTAMPAKVFYDAYIKSGVSIKRDQFGVINLVGRQNAMNALLNATGNKGAYPVSVMHPAYVQSTRLQGQEINDARLTKLNADIANTP